MDEIRILGILIRDRQKEAGNVQALLTKFGCSIKTRLGLHEVSADNCSVTGLIILELTGDVKEMDKLELELLKLEGVETQKMKFE